MTIIYNLQIEGQYKLVNSSSILTTVIDVIADAFVVFVLHGGMLQIGLATSLGYIVPFFVCASFYAGKKSASVFRLKFKGFSPKLCAEMIRFGAPMGVTKGSKALGGLIINNLLTFFNMPYLVAAHGVFAQITVFVRAAWYAPADTLMAFAGVFVGEEDKKSIKLSQRISLIHALVMSSVVTVVLFVFCDPLAAFFLKSDNPEALELAKQCIKVSCLSLPFHTIVYNFNNYLMGIKRLRFANIYSFLIECGNLIPITFLMLRVIGYEGKIAIAFAMEHGADKKRARKYGLITEELSVFLAEHGFNDGKEHNINMRLVAKGDDLIIRMRDDCKPMNLKDYYKLLQGSQDKKEEEINLAIILKMAKDVKYTATFGANNLIVRV